MKSLLRKIRRNLRILLGRDIRPRIQVNCSTEKYGSEYGGWEIYPDKINSESVIYSFGVGEDASWDLAMIEKFNVDIFAFDPTPRSVDWVRRQNFPKQFKMYPYGIASFEGDVSFNPPENPAYISHTILDRPTTKNSAITVPVFRLATIMEKLGHQKIDILKMDVEGAEYDVIKDILESHLTVYQMLVEFHHRFPNVGINQTKEAIAKLNSAGYRIMAVSPNGEEYSFIKLT